MDRRLWVFQEPGWYRMFQLIGCFDSEVFQWTDGYGCFKGMGGMGCFN